MKRLFIFLTSIATAVLSNLSLGQDDIEFWPNPDCDPSIPSFEEVLGYKPGERITWHRDAIRYFETLAEAAPDRITITEYARSWQNRELIYAVVSAPENISNLEFDCKTLHLDAENQNLIAENLYLLPLGSVSGVLDPARSTPAARPRHGAPDKIVFRERGCNTASRQRQENDVCLSRFCWRWWWWW